MRTDIILEGNDYTTADFPSSNNTPIGISDMQHIADNFLSEKGEWKQYPTMGIGITKYLKSSGNALLILKKEVKYNLSNDGYTSDTQPYSLVNNELNINFSKIKSLS